MCVCVCVRACVRACERAGGVCLGDRGEGAGVAGWGKSIIESQQFQKLKNEV